MQWLVTKRNLAKTYPVTPANQLLDDALIGEEVEMISATRFGDYQYSVEVHKTYLPLSELQNLFGL